jgi:TonB family protein
MPYPRKMRKPFLFLLLLLPAFSFAQKKDTLIRFINSSFESDTRERAAYVAKTWEENGAWIALVYNNLGKLVMTGQYKDKSLKLKQGRFVFYHPNGFPEQVGRYENTQRTGPWLSYYEDGMTKDSVTYSNNMRNGMALGWHQNGQRRYAGTYKDSYMEGPWIWFHRNGVPSTKEEYTKGKLMKLECFDSTGQFAGSNCSISTQPGIKGKYGGIQKYIMDSLTYPKEALQRALQGTVTMEFKVSQEGKAGEFNVISTPDSILSNEVIRLIKSVDTWYPAIEHNQVVDYTFRLFIPFTLPETY